MDTYKRREFRHCLFAVVLELRWGEREWTKGGEDGGEWEQESSARAVQLFFTVISVNLWISVLIQLAVLLCKTTHW